MPIANDINAASSKVFLFIFEENISTILVLEPSISDAAVVTFSIPSPTSLQYGVVVNAYASKGMFTWRQNIAIVIAWAVTSSMISHIEPERSKYIMIPCDFAWARLVVARKISSEYLYECILSGSSLPDLAVVAREYSNAAFLRSKSLAIRFACVL